MLNSISQVEKEKNNQVDYNIEYAHIYTDQDFNLEQIASIEKTKEIIQDLEKRKKTYSLVVLIDDYHPHQIKFDQQAFVSKLKNFNLMPDYIAFESKLADYKDDILNSLPPKEARELNKYLQKKEKLNCSFLIVGWYLLRLGFLPFKNQLAIKISKNEKPFCGQEIINILEKKYVSTEVNVSRTIKKSIFKDSLKKINNIFY
ncbi:MAG: hypothetical protein NTZ18_04715 [Candidatus Komeilibacteria bacterium]|nr:hypothetical protein [Candidatus Komeilibacteria bacterium]